MDRALHKVTKLIVGIRERRKGMRGGRGMRWR